MSTRKTARRDVPCFGDPLLDQHPKAHMPRVMVTREEYEAGRRNNYTEIFDSKFPKLFGFYELKEGDWENLSRHMAYDFVPGFRPRDLRSGDIPDYDTHIRRIAEFQEQHSVWKDYKLANENEEFDPLDVALEELAAIEEGDTSNRSTDQNDPARKRQRERVRRSMEKLREAFAPGTEDSVIIATAIEMEAERRGDVK